ncbi:hypothetical protein ACFYTS_36285 [Nocardia sp. NPDC004151]|uniref:hypothetical protein n=1 Tax=Nocardia sp. NPDC004151 TaxID=3364304 RepID=UPI003693E94F
MTSLMDFRIITVSEAEQRFGVSVDVQHPYQDLASEQEIRLYEGGLSVEGTMEPESDDDWVRYNVDGDLTGTGNIAWWDSASGNFPLVTGNVRVRNVVLSGCPSVSGEFETVGESFHGIVGDSIVQWQYVFR